MQLRLPLIILVALALTASALSDEEKTARKAKADEANKDIRHIKQEELRDRTREGLWLVMFGTLWCTNTQKATPKWLEFQKLFDAKYSPTSKTFGIGKVDCTDNEGANINISLFLYQRLQSRRISTLLLLTNGTIYEEYLGDDDAQPTLEYIEKMKALFTPKLAIGGAVVKQNVEEKVGDSIAGVTAAPEKAVKSKAGVNTDGEETGEKKNKTVVGGSLAAVFGVGLLVVVGVVAYRMRRVKRGRSRSRSPRDKYRTVDSF
ncbi:hypothetical protein BC829DRAFT_441573 [Chytridium lagenaria]|nr:hypothetical protein BC829DRAFT_441573 [Chytridium lagenaria]